MELGLWLLFILIIAWVAFLLAEYLRVRNFQEFMEEMNFIFTDWWAEPFLKWKDEKKLVGEEAEAIEKLEQNDDQESLSFKEGPKDRGKNGMP